MSPENRAAWKQRGREEWALFKLMFWEVMICIFVLFYIARIVTRRLAFFVYEGGDILKDLGFELIPKLEDARFYSEICVGLMHFTLVYTCILCTVRFSKKVYFMNILRRYLILVTVNQMLRAITFLPTSLPGPADHCRPDSDLYSPVDSWGSVFWDKGSLDSIFFNCGDLIFSGHMMHVTTGILISIHYHNILTAKRIMWLATIMIPIESFLIIGGRQHYSVDVVVGVYVGALMFYCTIDRLKDKEVPENVKLAEEENVGILTPIEKDQYHRISDENHQYHRISDEKLDMS